MPVPVPLLGGEVIEPFMSCYSGKHLLVLSNYRVIIALREGFYSLPLGLIQEVKHQHPKDLILLCKDVKTIRYGSLVPLLCVCVCVCVHLIVAFF